MKKFIYLLILVIGFSGCSTEPLEDQSQISDVDARMNFKASEAINPMGFYTPSGNLKGTYTVSNDCSNMYIEITPSGDAPDEVSIWLSEGFPSVNNGGNITDETSYSLPDAVNLVWTIPLSELNTESDINVFVKAYGRFAGPLSYSAEGSNKSVAYSSYTFDLSNCPDCEESFSYDDASDEDPKTYTFYYTPAENMTGAVLVFTFAQSVEISGLEDWTNNGNGTTSSTEQTTMDLEACKTYEWTVTLEKECQGNSGNSNLWTDFKVNDDSKKGDLHNIKQSCN